MAEQADHAMDRGRSQAGSLRVAVGSAGHAAERPRFESGRTCAGRAPDPVRRAKQMAGLNTAPAVDPA